MRLNTIRNVVAALVFLLGFGAAALAATVNGGTLTVTRDSVVVYADKTTDIHLFYANAAGTTVHVRVLHVDAACTAVTDNLGNVVAATPPAALCTAITTFTGTLDSLIASGAGGHKLDL